MTSEEDELERARWIERQHQYAYEGLLIERAEVVEGPYRYALPRDTVEAEYFLWDALYHLTGGAILCRVPRRGVDAGKVIRDAIARVQAQQR